MNKICINGINNISWENDFTHEASTMYLIFSNVFLWLLIWFGLISLAMQCNSCMYLQIHTTFWLNYFFQVWIIVHRHMRHLWRMIDYHVENSHCTSRFVSLLVIALLYSLLCFIVCNVLQRNNDCNFFYVIVQG